MAFPGIFYTHTCWCYRNINSSGQTSALPSIWWNWRSADVVHSKATATRDGPSIQHWAFLFLQGEWRTFSTFISVAPRRTSWGRAVPRIVVLVPNNGKQRSDLPGAQRKLRSERRHWCLHPQAYGSGFSICPTQACHVRIFSFIQSNIQSKLESFKSVVIL